MRLFRAILLNLSLVLSITLVSSVSFANASIKTGIGNCAELQNITNNLSGNYELLQDIDCQGIDFSPIGNISTPFTGSLDGNGHKIMHLSIIKETSDNVGLFGVTYQEVRIANLVLENVMILGRSAVGTLIGYANGATTVSNVHADGAVDSKATGSAYTGGLIGNMVNGTFGSVIDSSANVIVKAIGTSTGGLIGANNSFSITNSHATGEVFGYQQVGGLAGNNAGTVTNSYATGVVHGSSNTGGLLGYGPATINSSYSTGDVISTNGSSCTGGLIGYHQFGNKVVNNSYATGGVTGSDGVGGFYRVATV